MINQETIFRVSRIKLSLMTVGALGFVVVGIIMIIKAVEEFNAVTALIALVSLASVVFFGICLFFGVFRLFSKKPGLILKKDGFEDYSSMLGGHFIPWKEVEGIDSLQIQKQRFIRVLLRNPDVVISRSRGLQRFVMTMNYKFYGSPIHISSNSLKCDFHRLNEEFNKTWQLSR